MVDFTEADAARAFARAWNRLDPADFLEHLRPEARYASQWVLEELVGKRAIADYLVTKMRTVKDRALHNPATKVFAELGKTTAGSPGRDCVFMAQGRKEKSRPSRCLRWRRTRSNATTCAYLNCWGSCVAVFTRFNAKSG